MVMTRRWYHLDLAECQIAVQNSAGILLATLGTRRPAAGGGATVAFL